MKLRQIKHALTKRVMTHRILRSGEARHAVRISIKCDISGVIDGIARVNASMLRFSAAAAEAAIISQQFAEALSPHRHAIDDWRLHQGGQG